MRIITTLAAVLVLAAIPAAAGASPSTDQNDVWDLVQDLNRVVSVDQSVSSERTVRFTYLGNGNHAAAMDPVEESSADDTVIARIPNVGGILDDLTPLDKGGSESAYLDCTVELAVDFGYQRGTYDIGTSQHNDGDANLRCSSTPVHDNATVTIETAIIDRGVLGGGNERIDCPADAGTGGARGCEHQQVYGPGLSWAHSWQDVPVLVTDHMFPEVHGAGSQYDHVAVFTIDIQDMNRSFTFCAYSQNADSVGTMDVTWLDEAGMAASPHAPCHDV